MYNKCIRKDDKTLQEANDMWISEVSQPKRNWIF